MKTRKRLLQIYFILLVLLFSSASAQIQKDIVNGWHFLRVISGGIGSFATRITDTAYEGNKAQVIKYSVSDRFTEVHIAKKLKQTYETPVYFRLTWKVLKITESYPSGPGIYINCFQSGNKKDSVQTQVIGLKWAGSDSWYTYHTPVIPGFNPPPTFDSIHFRLTTYDYPGNYEFIVDELVLIYGTSYSNPKCVVVIDRFGDGNEPVGVREKNGLLENYALSQNYPNPFNPSTNIKYSIPKESYVVLKVFDALGREVKTLVDKKQPAGEYEVNFNAGNLTSGIYYYHLRAGNYNGIKKMIILK